MSHSNGLAYLNGNSRSLQKSVKRVRHRRANRVDSLKLHHDTPWNTFF